MSDTTNFDWAARRSAGSTRVDAPYAPRQISGSGSTCAMATGASHIRRPGGAVASSQGRPSTPRSQLLDRLLGAPLDPSMRFSAFAKGPGNRMAFTTTRRIAMQASAPHRFLMILGAPGNGKTHLLQAMVLRRRNLFPTTNALFVSGERLAMEFQHALRNRRSDAFRGMMAELDLLAIDAVEGLASSDADQKTLAALLETMLTRGRTLVVSANRPPGQCDLDRALIRFLRGAHLAPISAPEPPVRLAALHATMEEARRRGRPLSVERRAVEYMAREMPVSIRTLRAALAHLDTIGKAQRTRAGVATVRDELGGLLRHAERRRKLSAISRARVAP